MGIEGPEIRTLILGLQTILFISFYFCVRLFQFYPLCFGWLGGMIESSCHRRPMNVRFSKSGEKATKVGVRILGVDESVSGTEYIG